MMHLPRLRFESWSQIRRRMIQETEHFINEALRNPDRRIIIPAIKVGSGEFPRGFAQKFWSQVLGTP